MTVQVRTNSGFLLKLVDARLSPVTYNSLLDVEKNADNTFSVANFLTMEV